MPRSTIFSRSGAAATARLPVRGSYGEVTFAIGIVSILTIFMTLSDRGNQRTLFGISALLYVVGILILALFKFTLPVVVVHIVIMGIAGGFGAQSFF